MAIHPHPNPPPSRESELLCCRAKEGFYVDQILVIILFTLVAMVIIAAQLCVKRNESFGNIQDNKSFGKHSLHPNLQEAGVHGAILHP